MSEPDSLHFLPFRQRAPFAGLFIAACLGVLAADQQPGWWPLWCAAALSAALVVLSVGSTTPACLLAFFIFGFWHGNHVSTDSGYQRSRQKPFDANEHTVTLLVLSEPKIDRLRSIQRFVGLVSCLDNRPVHFQVSADCFGEPFSYGDRIIAQGNFYLPNQPLNPGEFDFGGYLQRQNIYLNFRTHRNTPAMVIAHNQGNPFVASTLSARHQILQALQEGLEDDAEVAQTIQGMILGGQGRNKRSAEKDSSGTPEQFIFSQRADCKSVCLLAWLGAVCAIPVCRGNGLLWQSFLWQSPIAPSLDSILPRSGPR